MPTTIEGDLPRGTLLGRYRVEDPVGRGGMGTVYSAYDETTRRYVAVKVLAPGLSHQLRSRFLAESEAQANIRHENVMPVYDRGWLSDERPFFAMELLYEPITLGDIRELDARGMLGIEQPRLRHFSERRRLIHDVLLPIIEGVGVANSEYGMQHRDLKPDNVLVDIRTRRPYLIDFGICRAMSDPAPSPPAIVGTPRFLSPEQARGSVDPRTDVWGCGCLLYYVLAGEPPLDRTSPFTRKEVDDRIRALTAAEGEARAQGRDAQARGYAARRAQLQDPELRTQEDLLKDAREGRYLPLPSNVDPALLAVVQKAMAVDPQARYATATQLAEDLRAWLSGRVTLAIQEGGRTDAAADVARRAIARHLLRGVAALVALGVGILLGLALFQEVPVAADHRQADLDALLAAAQAAYPAARPPEDLADLERRRAWRARVDRARQRTAPSADARPLFGAPPALTTVDWTAGEYQVRELVPPGEWSSKRTSTTPRPAGDARTALRRRREGASLYEAPRLAEGLWHLQSLAPRGLDLRMCVRQPGPGQEERDRIYLAPLEAEVPLGMTWIPAGPSQPDATDAEPAFLAMSQPVSNYEYGEWLDELEARQRTRHVPPSGFQRDRSDPTRYVPDAALADRPVRGLAPSSMLGYATWRAEIEQRDLALPTPAQWRRMAGIDVLGEVGAHRLLPFGVADAARAAWRSGEGPISGTAEADVSPNGVRSLLSSGGEVVRNDGTGEFGVQAAHRCLPRTSALMRTMPIAPDARAHEFVFRLVLNVE